MYHFDTSEDDGRLIQCPVCGWFVNYQHRAGHACCQNWLTGMRIKEHRISRELTTWGYR